MHTTRIARLIGMAAMTGSAAMAQMTPPPAPHLVMWPERANVDAYPALKGPASAIVMTRDDSGGDITNPLATDKTPQTAANEAFDSLLADANAGWINSDHMALFKRGIAVDLQVFGSTTNPDTDSATQRGATWNSPRSKGDRDSLGTDKSFMKSSISLA